MSNALDISAAVPHAAAHGTGTFAAEEREASPVLPFERYDWTPMAFCIMLAGGVYPVILVLIFMGMGAISIVSSMWERGIDTAMIGELLGAAGIAFAYGVVGGGFIGFVWAGAVCLVVLPVMYMLAHSLRLGLGFTMFSACCGGMVGFVAVMPFIALVTSSTHWDVAELLWVLAMGPGLTTVLGQLGGAIGGRREVVLNWAVRAAIDVEPGRRQPLQFGLRQLLWTSVWLSLLLTAVKLSGVTLEVIAPVIVGWIFFQSVTLYLGWIVAVRAWPRWRAWRSAGRST